MSKRFGLISLFFVLFLLVGGLLMVGQAASAAPGARAVVSTPQALGVPQGVAASSATTLSLSLPDVPLESGYGNHKSLDLWRYTTYDDDKATLVYTVTGGTGAYNYLVYEIVSGRYFSMTSDTSLDKDVEFFVEATDGVLTATDIFEVNISDRPQLDFFSAGLSSLRDPVYAFGGKGLTQTIDLWYYAYDYEDDDSQLNFYITHPPTSTLQMLGLVVTDGHYLDFVPPLDVYGTFPIEMMIEDTSGLTDTDTFTLTVLQETFMPAVLKNYPLVPTLEPIDNSDGDGEYWLRWSLPGNPYASYYETEFSFNDPTFANGQTATTDNAYQHGYYSWPGTHYWRVRAYFYDEELGENVPTAWSNVESTTVGQFAYLWVDNTKSYAFDMRVEISGNGMSDSITYSPQEYGYWRSVPVGTYTIKVISDYIWLCPGGNSGQRTEQIYLGNSIEQGAFYSIDPCETIGPTN